jgi:hypothetical protein
MNFLEIITQFVNKKTVCYVFGHKIVTVRNVTNHFKEYKCTCCNVELTNDLQNKKSILTPQLREINETLLNHFNRKHLSSL